jgi:hypothetical protein
MVATVNNSPAAAAGKKTADLPQQAPATGASALRLNNADGNDFAKMSRSIVVDYGEKVSPREVKALLERYELLQPYQPPHNALETGNRLGVDNHMRQLLGELQQHAQSGKLSRSDFDRISAAVIQVKLDPSAASHRKAIFAVTESMNRELLPEGQTARARDQLMQTVIERGNFGDDRNLREWSTMVYDPASGRLFAPNGTTIDHESNTEKAYHILTTLDPSAVDGTEMDAFRSQIDEMLTRGNGFFSDADIQRLTVLRDLANDERRFGDDESRGVSWRTQPVPMPLPPVNTIQPFPIKFMRDEQAILKF